MLAINGIKSGKFAKASPLKERAWSGALLSQPAIPSHPFIAHELHSLLPCSRHHGVFKIRPVRCCYRYIHQVERRVRDSLTSSYPSKRRMIDNSQPPQKKKSRNKKIVG